MKRRMLVFLGALVFTAGPVFAADSLPGKTEISVAGTGSVTRTPDVANVGASVETTAPNADDAVSRNNEIYDRIVAALAKAGVARQDVTLSYYNMNYNPRPRVVPPQSDGERYGYTVSRGFNVKVRSIGNAGRVADACTSAGATAINGVTFDLADSSTALGEATRKAVADARARAEALAAASQLRIVGIKSIDLGGGGVFPPRPEPMMMKAASNAPTQFDQSNVNVSVSVNVTFIAEP
jgi:uncharacterized protein YggE